MPVSTLLRMPMEVELGQQFAATVRRLKDAGRGDLQKRMVKEIRREGQGALRAVQAATRGINVTPASRSGARSTGLRNRVAGATRISVTNSGIRLSVNSSKVDSTYGRSLAWYLHGHGRPWRHPVFGRRDRSQDWQQQRGEDAFFSTLAPYRDRWAAAASKVLDDYVRELDRG